MSSKEIYNSLKPDDPLFDHEITCPFCINVTEVIKDGRDILSFAHKSGDSFILDRWYCGACDKHFYTDFKDTD
jgi:hypothetical protein